MMAEHEYEVEIEFEGAISVTVFAKNKKQAKKKAIESIEEDGYCIGKIGDIDIYKINEDGTIKDD
jgi:hypothetical protein